MPEAIPRTVTKGRKIEGTKNITSVNVGDIETSIECARRRSTPFKSKDDAKAPGRAVARDLLSLSDD